jgi:hypothetical protein
MTSDKASTAGEIETSVPPAPVAATRGSGAGAGGLLHPASTTHRRKIVPFSATAVRYRDDDTRQLVPITCDMIVLPPARRRMVDPFLVKSTKHDYIRVTATKSR